VGKPSGFLEFEREVPVEREPMARQGDWTEFTSHLPEPALKQQASRCMDCGIPFCCGPHPPITRTSGGCPISNKIPEWNHLVYRGDWQGAYHRLRVTNNFPEFTGRVCPAPCEGSCVLGINAPAVAIKSIENAIVDRAFEEGWIVPEPPIRRTGRRVAVVGSGPAGLACADQLNRAGHQVTVFERADRIGGLLRYGIPPMKLGKDVVQRRVDLLAAEGIVFKSGVDVGTAYPVSRLVAEHDALVLAVGATRPRDLKIEGRELDGVHFAMEFLQANQKSIEDSGLKDGAAIRATDRDVIVIGGGDTGTDCVATAIRDGCRSLTQFEIMPQPPGERGEANPWPEWPRVYKLDYGQKEAAARFGSDPREYLLMTRAFYGDGDGRVSGLETVSLDTGGMPMPGSERTYKTDLVLLAMGFTGPELGLVGALGVDRDERSNVRAEYGAFQTSVPGVFAAGDVRRGQSLVVWAINEGRGAARAVDRYLMGESALP
jgi:glutamate synthase (NADPH/NADH) small chain